MILNLGQVRFGLGVDTRDLGRAVQRVQQFGNQVRAAQNATTAAGHQIAAAYRRQEAAVTSALQRILRLNDQIRRTANPREQVTLLNQTRQAFLQLEAQLARGPRHILAYQRANESLTASLGSVQRRLSQIRAEQARARAGNTEFGVLLRDLASASVLALGPLSGIGARIAALGAVASRSSIGLAAFIGAVVSVGTIVSKLSTAAVRTALEIQRIETRLLSTTGATELAAAEFDNLKRLADATGLEFITLATQFTKFQAAAQGTALEGAAAREIFENMAFAVGQFQLEAVQAEGVFRALEQIMSKGTVAAEEIRQQLGDRLPGAFKAAADAIGVTTEQFNKMLKQGKISSEQFLLPFSRQVRARLAGDAVESVDSLRASLNRLTNSMTFFNDSFDNAFGISTAFKAGVETLTNTINFLGRNIKAVAVIVGALTGGLTIMALPRIIAGFAFLARAVQTATGAFIGLNTAVAVSPLGRVATVVTRLIAIIGGAVLGFQLFAQESANAAVAEEEVALKTDILIESQEELGKSVTDTASQFVKAAKIKLEAIGQEIEAVHLQMQAYRSAFREQIQTNAALKAIAESNTRFFDMINEQQDPTTPQLNVSAFEAAMLTRLQNLNAEYKTQEERIRKLHEILSKPITPGGIGDGETLGRAGKALREASQAIDELLLRSEAMMKGPKEFAVLEEQIEMNKKIQDFKDRLIDAEVPLDSVREKVAQYTFALQTHNEISKGVFKDMTATYEAFKGIAVSGFQSMADAVAQAVMDGDLSAKTFVDVFRDMVQKIIAETLKLAVINPILNSIFGVAGGQALPVMNFGSILPFAKGGAFDQGRILKSPTPFMTRSGPAVAGEEGPEAVMPLVMGAQGLGIRAYTGSSSTSSSPAEAMVGGDRISNIYVTFQTPDAGSFMKSQSQVSAVLAAAVQRGRRNM